MERLLVRVQMYPGVEGCDFLAQESGRGAYHAVHRLRGSLVQHSLPRGPSKTTGMVGQTNNTCLITYCLITIGKLKRQLELEL